MLKLTLSKIRSWFYRNDFLNPAVKEIDELIGTKLHPNTELDETTLSERTQKEIKRIGAILEKEERDREQQIKKFKKRRK